MSIRALIPKIDCLIRLEDYKPISLVGCTYKILAKLLATRLSKIIDCLISENQSAFVKGRNILDGVMVINELCDYAKKKKRCKAGLVFKVNFEKAYDYVSWEFLDYMLVRIRFSVLWRKWISECLSSSTVSVLVNESPSEEFRVSKGLRQGDPMAPFLFLIVEEGLSRIISNTVDRGIIKGYKISKGEKSMVLSHIQYDDDTVIVGEVSLAKAAAINFILRMFELVSGLRVNYFKICVVGLKADEGDNQRILLLAKLQVRQNTFFFSGHSSRWNPEEIHT